MAGHTVDAIKKKMQMMRVEKDAACERAEQFQHQLLLQRSLNEQVCSSLPAIQARFSGRGRWGMSFPVRSLTPTVPNEIFVDCDLSSGMIS